MNNWKIIQDEFSLETAQAFEGLFTLGSGYMHTRGSFEEHFFGCEQNNRQLRKPTNTTAEKFRPVPSKWGTYVPGIFGNHPLLLQEMINLPFFLELAPVIENERLDLQKSKFSNFRVELNMKTASLSRSLLWTLPSGNRVRICFERFISGVRTSLSVQRMTIIAAKQTELLIHAGITADLTTNGFDHFTDIKLDAVGENGVQCKVTTDSGDDITMRSMLLNNAEPSSTNIDTTSKSREAQLCQFFSLQTNIPLIIEKRTAVATSRDLIVNSVEKQIADIASKSWDELFAEHCAHWAIAWDGCDIVIEGDERSQQIIRSSIYHLLRAHVPNDSRVAVGAKGYAGEAYKGHFFWDTEIYLLPFYLYTFPEKAETLVGFRCCQLSAAKQLAQNYGYNGARYPWESDADGKECCSQFQYRDHEIHVTADVVYSIAHFFQATDRQIKGKAANVVVETARYWLDRLDWRKGDSCPSLLGVMGPDEYAPITNNNAFTNRLVSLNLALAAEIGESTGATKEECKAFADAAAGLPIVRSKKNPELVLQCEGFEEFAEPRFDEFWSNRKGCYAAQVSQERLYRSKNLKQADVLLMMAMFPDEFTDAEVRIAWDTYVPVTTHDSSLSAGIHAIIALRLELYEDAWKFFLKSADIDLDVTHGGASQGIHIAGCACNWQVIVFGFAGMLSAMQSEHLSLNPNLPAGWQKLCFPIVWKGTPLQIEITKTSTIIKNQGDKPINIELRGQTITVAAKKQVEIPND